MLGSARGCVYDSEIKWSIRTKGSWHTAERKWLGKVIMGAMTRESLEQPCGNEAMWLRKQIFITSHGFDLIAEFVGQ